MFTVGRSELICLWHKVWNWLNLKKLNIKNVLYVTCKKSIGTQLGSQNHFLFMWNRQSWHLSNFYWQHVISVHFSCSYKTMISYNWKMKYDFQPSLYSLRQRCVSLKLINLTLAKNMSSYNYHHKKMIIFVW